MELPLGLYVVGCIDLDGLSIALLVVDSSISLILAAKLFLLFSLLFLGDPRLRPINRELSRGVSVFPAEWF